MTGARYRELGDRRTIHVHRRTGLGGEVLYKIFRGTQCFDGRLAKVRGWKPVTK